MKINDYVENLFADVPDSREKSDIVQEIILNLEEKVQDLMEQGKDEEDAINKAIVDFGDISEIKRNLPYASTNSIKVDKTNYVNNLLFSLCGAALIIGLCVFINLYYSPNNICSYTLCLLFFGGL